MEEVDVDIDDLEIIVGTYEEFLLGYKVVLGDDETFSLAQSFATHSHRASVRSLAAGGKYLASGGSDESIFLYDMSTRKEAGLLMQHNGTISCLEFAPSGTHVLSGSEDGSIGACRTGSWQLEKLWGKAHKGSAVTSISIHPSGKLFLSVGVDATVRTWNFVKGRPAYTTIICKPKEGRLVTQVLWSPDGDTYAVVIGTRVEVFSIAEARVVYTIQLDKKITCVCYLDSDVLCSALEEGEVFLHSITEKAQMGQFKAHEGRVRCLRTFKSEWIVTASSEGEIKLWWKKDPKNILCVCGASTGCRITCMSLVCNETQPLVTASSPKKSMNVSELHASIDTEMATRLKPRHKPLGVVTVELDEAPSDNITDKKKKKQTRRGVVNHSTVKPTMNVIKESKKMKKKKNKGLIDASIETPTIGIGNNKTKKTKNKRVSFEKVVRESITEVNRGETLGANGMPNKLRTKRAKIEVLKEETPTNIDNVQIKEEVDIDDSSTIETPCRHKTSKRRRRFSTNSSLETSDKQFKKKHKSKQSGTIYTPSGSWSVE